ncbi:Fimbrial protein [Burkholderia ambifaria MC40-6]|uniref:Fimbrial protein n=1 Tax=Burkholderia ambifaria (strain MC40-6) TaxID=398577 RepID=B1YYQ7_BURA4|nr:fimbrial protein [Burkholderia ambifaria]ACB65767.1 Fimbrial protein [Burkholderia ambifaria MC40-6]
MKFIPILILVLLSNYSHASCTIKRSDGVMVPSLIVTLPKFSPPPFDPNIADGTVIYTSSGAASGLGGVLNCTSAIGDVIYVGTTGSAPGKYNAYPTPVAGVGVRIKGGINVTQWWPQSGNVAETSSNYLAGSEITIELVKTGNITAPGILSGEVGMTFALNHGTKIRSIVTNGAINIRPQVPTCNLLTPNIAVDLEKVSVGELKGIGATSLPKPMEVRLKCSGGNPGTSTRMFMTLTDSANSGNRSDTLSLASGSTAKGVGIQILRGSDNTLVSYGPDSAQAGNPNQWAVGSFGNVDVTIPFRARYVRTSATVIPGKANGVSTFTMSYQ